MRIVGLLSGVYGIGYLRRNEARGLVTPRMRREFYGLIPAYVFAMLLVSVSNSLGIMDRGRADDVGVGVPDHVSRSRHLARSRMEISGAGQPRPRLCPAGDRAHVRVRARFARRRHGALQWTRFMQVAPELHPFTLRLGVVFALIGYGTKAGLAPMHTWKPDAYREAPSPAVVLMAVGMLNGALYCVLRIHLISTASLGPEFSEGLLLTLGLLSVLIATPFVLIQWNVKRLLAYSSIEHVGIMAIGMGLGASGGVRGAVAHDLSLAGETRGALFCRHTVPVAQLLELRPHRAGNVHARAGHECSARARHGDHHGLSPFGLFFSEMTILRAGFSGAHPTATAVFLAALIVLFCGFAYQVGHLVLGPPRDPADRRKPQPERFDAAMATVIAAAAIAVVSAFYLPAPLMALIRAATQVIWSRG